ncbi:MAG: hypothetical protein KF819_17655 [Labilithrix sp.]|nr:hypothetical protein [Labilithrix sp.]
MSDDARRPGDTKPPPPAAKADTRPPSQDVVVLGPPTADGNGVHVLRAREERLETGELRAIAEGKPIVGEVVTLKPRDDNPRVCDVQESYAAKAPASHKGPAKVATQAYREGWDEIFGKRRDPSPRDLN